MTMGDYLLKSIATLCYKVLTCALGTNNKHLRKEDHVLGINLEFINSLLCIALLSNEELANVDVYSQGYVPK